jgi:type II secretory pathway component PulL
MGDRGVEMDEQLSSGVLNVYLAFLDKALDRCHVVVLSISLSI